MTPAEALEIVLNSVGTDDPPYSYAETCEAEDVLRNLVTSVTQIETWLEANPGEAVQIEQPMRCYFRVRSRMIRDGVTAYDSAVVAALHAWARTVQRSTTKETP